MSFASDDWTASSSLPRSLWSVEPECAWEHHGAAVWKLACAVLGDEPAARQAVALGMVDLYSQAGALEPVADTVLPDAARCVYRHGERIGSVARTMTVPQIVAWLGQMDDPQRNRLKRPSARFQNRRSQRTPGGRIRDRS